MKLMRYYLINRKEVGMMNEIITMTIAIMRKISIQNKTIITIIMRNEKINNNM
jgi:hypothetical protein